MNGTTHPKRPVTVMLLTALADAEIGPRKIGDPYPCDQASAERLIARGMARWPRETEQELNLANEAEVPAAEAPAEQAAEAPAEQAAEAPAEQAAEAPAEQAAEAPAKPRRRKSNTK